MLRSRPSSNKTGSSFSIATIDIDLTRPGTQRFAVRRAHSQEMAMSAMRGLCWSE
jgi:hypothetical protein